MGKAFKSRVDRITILRSILLFITPVVLLCISGAWNSKIVIGLFIIELLIFIPFGILLPLKTTYTVMDNGLLIIPAGIRKIKIKIRDITSIQNESSWEQFFLSSYVNSLNQLSLSYNKYAQIVISPNDKEAFIQALQAQNRAIIKRK